MEGDVLALLGLGVALGLRHGIDWDHIAAITDITSSTVSTEEAEARGLATSGVSGDDPPSVALMERPGRRWREGKDGFFLASFYALGHATVVVMLGLLAIWLGAILPEWLDPLMERIVGVTLVLLGVWIFYSLWRYGRSFRLRSRWMLVFSWARHGWAALQSRMTGRPAQHTHEFSQYGPKTAYGVGMVHGIGAETGSQALLLASAAGATGSIAGSVLLFAFTVGLLISNSMVASFSAFGFVSSATKRNIYVVVGIVAGLFSLFVGSFFLIGQGSQLPDLQEMLNILFGASPVKE